MQKAYNRINWQNDPSTNTPLGANNLNKVDLALNTIDDRVLSLYGYQDRVAQSEKNAKTSETNAKVSEQNAKQSELLAKQYAENAFSGTPEGYEQLVKDVLLMDIQTTTDTTLAESKAGGYKLVSMSGKSEQKTMSGKNLLNLYGTSKTENGITWTRNADNSVSVKGTSTARTYFYLIHNSQGLRLKAGKYTMSVGTDFPSKCVVSVGHYDGTTYAGNIIGFDTSSKTFTVSQDTYDVLAYFDVPSGVTIDVTLYPQLEFGEVATEYEPYIGGVELVQGAYSSSTGAYSPTYTSYVCTKTKIPCKSGDTIKANFKVDISACGVVYFNNDTYLSSANGTASGLDVVAPTNATHFVLNVTHSNGLTPEEASKVTLTVNGKPIYVHAGAYAGGMTSPSPYYPQAIQNVADCVEMISGAWSNTSGIFEALNNYICNKNPIPCKSGDVVKIFDLATPSTFYIVYYNESGYVSYVRDSAKKEMEFTIPSGVTKFNFDIGYTNITPDTVGKISITINDKYVLQIVCHAKNFFDKSKVTDGQGVGRDGKPYTSDIYSASDYIKVTSLKNYALTNAVWINWYDENGIGISISNGETVLESPSNAKYVRITLLTSNKDICQLEQGEVATDFEEYKESVATVLLNEPPRLGDKLFKDSDGLFKLAHNSAIHEINVDTIAHNDTSGIAYYVCVLTTKRPHGNNGLGNDVFCDKATFKHNSWDDGTFYENINNFVFVGSAGDTLETMQAKYNGAELQYVLAAPTIETLDTDSQIALNSIETFDTVTYINVDSRVQPSEIVSEYGTSKVGAITLKNELRNDTLEIKYNELAVALVATESGV